MGGSIWTTGRCAFASSQAEAGLCSQSGASAAVVAVSVLGWLFLGLVAAISVRLLLASCGRGQPDASDYRADVELHRIRRRLEVAQLRFELRRDGADARRALRADLRGLAERDRRA
jgi:hypothetical protein